MYRHILNYFKKLILRNLKKKIFQNIGEFLKKYWKHTTEIFDTIWWKNSGKLGKHLGKWRNFENKLEKFCM